MGARVVGGRHLSLCFVNASDQSLAIVDELADRPQHCVSGSLELVDTFVVGLMC